VRIVNLVKSWGVGLLPLQETLRTNKSWLSRHQDSGLKPCPHMETIVAEFGDSRRIDLRMQQKRKQKSSAVVVIADRARYTGNLSMSIVNLHPAKTVEKQISKKYTLYHRPS